MVEVATATPGLDSKVLVQAAIMNSCTQFFSKSWNLPEPKQHVEEPTEDEQTVTANQRLKSVKHNINKPIPLLALVNCFLPSDVQERISMTQNLKNLDEIPFVFECPTSPLADRAAAEFRATAVAATDDEGPPMRFAAALRSSPEAPLPLLPCCFLSAASVLSVQALCVKPGDAVLDLCAGPGAKALMLATKLFAPAISEPNLLQQVGEEVGAINQTTPVAPKQGRLVCNEPNRARTAQLEGLLSSFLPENLLAKGGDVITTRAEASHKAPQVLQRLGPFDKILVDPPCSSLRRQVKDSSIGLNSTHQRDPQDNKKTAELMEELLRCAGALVRPGGLIIYCTSSVEESENDDVVRKFVRRMDGEFEADSIPLAGAEQTAHGALILPTQSVQHGPLYLARLRRVGGE